MENQTQNDNQDFNPVRVEIARQERYSRAWALATLLFMIPKAIVLIPHLLILAILNFAAFVIVIIAQFAVLFTARYPVGMHEFLVGITRWQTRINAFMFGLTDKYPPFSLK